MIVEKLQLQPFVEDVGRIGGIFCVKLPVGKKIEAQELQDKLINDHNIYTQIIEYNKEFYLRLCCHVTNEMKDFEAISKALIQLLA